jgi:RNA-directed DNA polymerase
VSHGARGDIGNKASASEELQVSAACIQKQALETIALMEQVCDPTNLNNAYKKVVANKGAPGIDGMTVSDLKPWLAKNKAIIITQLLAGSYYPQPVRKVEIPKAGGGRRQLGIPTVIDRLVQQALLQVLNPIIDPQFSNSSYGFRPKRSAHQALLKAKEYAANGGAYVVDIDIEKFFDCVNHDILMARMAKRIRDKRILRIIRRFLQAGIMDNGVCVDRELGTPQGGPLSPLLANVLLDDLDKELEKRGHKFSRYADDCNIYVQSIRAGERVMESVTTFLIKRLRLKINKEKSGVAPSSGANLPGLYNHTMERTLDSAEKHCSTKRSCQKDNAKK